MKKQRVLVVGTGYWAEQHLKAYGLCRHVTVAGIVGHSDRTRVRVLAEQYRIPSVFMDVKTAIRSVKPDIVDIAGSPRYRLAGVRSCVGTGVRLVNLEKPMALTPSEAYRIEEVCRRHRLLLTVNHQKKFNRPWAKACSIIRRGTLGDIRFFRATCKGNAIEQGTHLVDMLLFFNSYAPIRSVMAQVADLDGLDKVKTPAPDSVSGLIDFSNGVRAHVTIGNIGWEVPGETNKWFHMAIEAYGTKGHLAIALNQTLEVVNYRTGRRTVEPSKWTETYVQGLAGHLDAAARYAASPKTGHISCLDNSMQSFQAILAMYESACAGGRVALPARFSDSLLKRLAALRKHCH